MVAYLQKPERSEAFHQIVDFLNASHIKYALIKNPKIYISLIQQFWRTATARTTDDGDVKIIASINGHIKTITEASLRIHLKLEDSDGITSLPNTEIFEQLALIGGRKISEIDKDPTISLVQPEQDMEYDFDVSTTEGFTTASIPVTTASATPEVSTAAENLVYIRKSVEKRKDKGKAIMKEDE
ncbi:hypothetical protein Tco_1520215, partial [Tanacetum coccineum]